MRHTMIKLVGTFIFLIVSSLVYAAVGWEVVGEFYSNSSYNVKVGLGAQRCPDANGQGGDAHPSNHMIWGHPTNYMKVISKRRCEGF